VTLFIEYLVSPDDKNNVEPVYVFINVVPDVSAEQDKSMNPLSMPVSPISFSVTPLP